jgi:ribonucleoside-triphosphate reductase
MDREQFDDPLFANGRGKEIANPFYTNSSQLPVNYTDDIVEALDLQDSLQTKYTGGTVMHLFLGERIKEYSAVKSMVRTICEKYRMPYFTLTPTFSICRNCGYQPGEVKICEKCGSECEIYSRIVGYLRPVNQWNEGKAAEYDIRKLYKPLAHS